MVKKKTKNKSSYFNMSQMHEDDKLAEIQEMIVSVHFDSYL